MLRATAAVRIVTRAPVAAGTTPRVLAVSATVDTIGLDRLTVVRLALGRVPAQTDVRATSASCTHLSVTKKSLNIIIECPKSLSHYQEKHLAALNPFIGIKI